MFDIITDFSCDLPQEILERYEIKRVPMYIVNNNEKIKVDDNFDYIKDFYKNEQLYSLWLQGKLKTSQPAIKDFLDVIQSSQSKDILIITLSSKLSGTYNVAKSAARLLKAKGYNITVFDSKTVSAGLGLYVQVAAKLREEGKSIEEVVNALSKLEVKLFAVPMDIKYLLIDNGSVGTLEFIDKLLEPKVLVI